VKRFLLIVTTLAAVAVGVVGVLPPELGIPVAAGDKPARDTGGSLKSGEERVPAGEDEVIKELVALQVAIMKNTDPTKRGQHAKHHGCVEAKFVVRGDIPKEYQVGLFKEARSYKAKVRFSNGRQKDDRERDVHGMAIKVLKVKGPRALEKDSRAEQDFVLIDSEVFFAPDAKTVLEFMKAGAASKKDPEAMKKFAQKDPATAARVQASLRTPPSPLAVQYWSTVPFKLGDRAVKYTVKPGEDNGPKDAKPSSEDYLRQIMVERLTKGKRAVVFNLCIIPQTDPVKMPVEDPTVRWESEPVPVATVTIEPQTFNTPKHMKECEESSFDPWHALAEHRPLGGVNRARKAVYPASVEVRKSKRS